MRRAKLNTVDRRFDSAEPANLTSALTVGVSAIADAVDGDGVAGLVKQDAVIADAEAEQPLKLAAKRLNSALAGFGVAVESAQDVQGSLMVDCADFFPDVRLSRPYGRGPGPW